MKKPTEKLLLSLIFALALFLRLYKLGQFPVGFLWDEAALGYNAYSILKTAKDEYGQFLPLIFKSFGDYKPGFYVYLTVPSIALLGLNEMATRLPSALFGSLAVLAVYGWIKETGKKTEAESARLALLTAFLLAINPWHIGFSRGAWELNVMTTEIIFGLFFLAKFFNFPKRIYLYFSSLFFILALFTYQAAKLLVLALLVGYLFFYRRESRAVLFRLKVGFVAINLAGLVLLSWLTLGGGKAGRLKVMSVFSYPRSVAEAQLLQKQDGGQKFPSLVFHNSPVFFSRSILERYFNHFSGKFLFFTGDWSNPRNGTAYQGGLYFLDLPFLLIGLGILFGRKRLGLENFMLYWLLLAPLPSALTRDSISSVRSFSLVIPLIFVTAIGINGLYEVLQRRRVSRPLFLAVLLLAYAGMSGRFLDLYFCHDPKVNSRDRLYGYKETVRYLQPLVEKKDKVIFTTKYGQPYIFYLFYTQYNPQEYQKVAQLKENPYGDVGEVEKIGKIEFRKVYWPADRSIPNAIFVDDEFGLPDQDIIGEDKFVFLKEVRFLNKEVAFRVVETKQ